MVVVGFTGEVPVKPTSPTFGEIFTLVAFTTFQTRFDCAPDVTCAGVAWKLMICGGPPPTVTVTLLVTWVPSLPVAVRV